MKKVKITMPCKNGKWKVSFGKTPFMRNSATTAYTLLERKMMSFLASCADNKTAVCLKDGGNVVNETAPSDSRDYLLYTSACFLEDFLAKRFVNKVKKQYARGI